MCRIAGIFHPGNQTLSRDISRMTGAMRRGGPDDEGVYLDQDWPLAFGHRRLSIIDLSSGGHQPMAVEDGRLRIVFNGEIYNYRSLRDELRAAGWTFHTASDTEVILRAYQQWGTGCFARFNGMFALAILDRVANQLVLARDHAGIKPLYYWLGDGQLYFASEIRAFGQVSRPFHENPGWRMPFLAFGHLPEPETTLAGVKPLETGHCMVLSLPSLRATLQRYTAPVPPADVHDRQDALRLLRSGLEAAVARHLVSDAPIGLLLSGGIDSSILALLAKPVVGEHLVTLSITFDEARFSERRYQQIIVERIGGQHHDCLVTHEDFNRLMPEALEAMDQPTIDGINSFFISLHARQSGLKAVLAGHGADELFGGYPTFGYGRYYRVAQRLPRALLSLLGRMPDPRLGKLGYARLAGLVGENLTYRSLFPACRIARLLGTTEDEVLRRLARAAVPELPPGLDDGSRISRIETGLFLQNQLLKDSDFMSMWHGLEIRVPFLDQELMALVYRIDGHLKFSDPLPKRLLIDAAGPELPEEVWNRPKQGFTFPFEQWMKDSPITAPRDSHEAELYREFKRGQLGWGRYWCALLAGRFAPVPH
ncbi:MAG: asparagine synthase (glutamine-hydrolyzing) [Gammaproteobacteria bacterium]|nr:asparagine synthase (glutamine-hydrolyzing) [Gammaproteobacteria bacterium]